MDLRGLREVLQVVSHKWDLEILTHLSGGPLRYSELANLIRRTASDLNDGVLSKNLRRLQANGLIDQIAQDGHRHAWALTALAERLMAELARISAFHTDLRKPNEAAAGAARET